MRSRCGEGRGNERGEASAFQATLILDETCSRAPGPPATRQRHERCDGEVRCSCNKSVYLGKFRVCGSCLGRPRWARRGRTEGDGAVRSSHSQLWRQVGMYTHGDCSFASFSLSLHPPVCVLSEFILDFQLHRRRFHHVHL